MAAFTRRNFIRTSVIAGVGTSIIKPFPVLPQVKQVEAAGTRVAITTGAERADMVFRALKPFSEQIKRAVANKKIVIKPNIVNINVQLASTHVSTVEGVLEFFRSIGRTSGIVIAESAANGPTTDGYENFGYIKVAEKYGAKLIDLDNEPVDRVHVFDEKDIRPHPVRIAHLMLDPDSFIVSVARMKTHDRVFATLSLKNIVVGAPIKDKGFTFDSRRKSGTTTDKSLMHGSGFRGINYNLYTMSHLLHPHLAIIDGYEGMEGNGPNDGQAVDHKVCVAGLDWLATDRVGIELMGIDYSTVGYLNFCNQTGPWTADLSKIEIIGETIEKHRRKYRLSDNAVDQLVWMKPLADNYEVTNPNHRLSYNLA